MTDPARLRPEHVAFADQSPPGTWRLELTPASPPPTPDKIRILLDRQTAEVLQTTTLDGYGNTDTWAFRETHTNQGLPTERFDFEPSDDIRVVNPDKECDGAASAN